MGERRADTSTGPPGNDEPAAGAAPRRQRRTFARPGWLGYWAVLVGALSVLSVVVAVVFYVGRQGPRDHLTAGQFTHRANAICARSAIRLGALAEPATIPDAGRWLVERTRIGFKTVNDLSDLNPPPPLRTRVGRAIDFSKYEVYVLISAVHEVDKGIDARVALAAELSNLHRLEAQAKSAWSRLGAHDCA